MILTNTNPNNAWAQALGQQGYRWPPGSWEQGGGGYMGLDKYILAPPLPRYTTPRYVGLSGYGAYATGSPQDLVMGDVIDAISRAFAELNAEALLASNLTADQKSAAVSGLVTPEAQLESLATGGRQAVLSGALGLDQWFAQAQAISDAIKPAAGMIDPGVSSWLDGVISSAQNTALGPSIPIWAIGLGVVAAGLIGYKLLSK